ncbi:hypothetical protein K1X76_07705 [bacterium]|nr:hypothetical protein [bacterium]
MTSINTNALSSGAIAAYPLHTEGFKNNLEAMLDTGLQGNYDNHYVTSQILDEIKTNPYEANKLGLKNDYEWVKNNIVDSYNLYKQAGFTKSIDQLAKNPTPFVLKMTEHGEKASPTPFNAEINLYRNGKILMRTEGNSWPDKSDNSPGIAAGVYLGKYSTTGHKNRDGIVINQNKYIPSIGPNPDHGNQWIANAIHVHSGGNKERGSEGCLTIPKNQAMDIWNAISTESADVIIILERDGQ